MRKSQVAAGDRPYSSWREDDHPAVRSPLAGFNGKAPPSPAWFKQALQVKPVEFQIVVDDVEIEVLEWGRSSMLSPVVLLHGSGASADWWRFIAPFIAGDRRVIALSWSGMGKSGWRDTYSFEAYADEALAISKATELSSAGQAPILVGHSMGGMVGTLCCIMSHTPFQSLVVIDGNILDYGPPADWRELLNEKRIASDDWPSYNVYPTLAAALSLSAAPSLGQQLYHGLHRSR